MQQIEDVFLNLGIKDSVLLDEVIAHIKKNNQIKKASHNQATGSLKREHTDLIKLFGSFLSGPDRPEWRSL